MLQYHQAMTGQYNTERFCDVCEEAEKTNSNYNWLVMVGAYAYIIDQIKQVNDRPVLELSRSQICRVLKRVCAQIDPEPIIEIFVKHGLLNLNKLGDGKEMIQAPELNTTLTYIEKRRAAGAAGGRSKAENKGGRMTLKQKRMIDSIQAEINAKKQANYSQ